VIEHGIVRRDRTRTPSRHGSNANSGRLVGTGCQATADARAAGSCMLNNAALKRGIVSSYP